MKIINISTQFVSLQNLLWVLVGKAVGRTIDLVQGGKHHPERSWLKHLGKSLESSHFIMSLFTFQLQLAIGPRLRSLSSRITYLTIIFQYSTKGHSYSLDQQPHVCRSIPGTHLHTSEQRSLLSHLLQRRVVQNVQIAHAITISTINVVIDNQKMTRFGVDIHKSHHSNPPDDRMVISAFSPSYQNHFEVNIFIEYHAIAHQIVLEGWCYQVYCVFQDKVRRIFTSYQSVARRAGSKLIRLISKIGQQTMYLADKQISAVC